MSCQILEENGLLRDVQNTTNAAMEIKRNRQMKLCHGQYNPQWTKKIQINKNRKMNFKDNPGKDESVIQNNSGA